MGGGGCRLEGLLQLKSVLFSHSYYVNIDILHYVGDSSFILAYCRWLCHVCSYYSTAIVTL